MSNSFDPRPWRAHFPILSTTTYLVTHSLGAMPAGVRGALADYAETWATRGVRAWHEGWWELPVTVGDQLARLMNAPAGSVCMHTNVSDFQSLLASCFDFTTERNRIVYSDQNFPTNMYVWEQRPGAEVVVVPAEPDGRVPLERLLEAIDERTAVVPVSHVLFRSSWQQDAAAICARAREVGALVLLDTYQSLGTVPVDVTGWDVDMAVGGSVKWLLGGPGAAYLYVRPELQERLRPRSTGWAAHAEPFAFETGPQRHAEGIRRFLTGTPPVPSLIAAQVGYSIVEEVGVSTIRAHSVRLLDRLTEQVREGGFEVFGPERSEDRGGTLTIALDEGEDGAAFVSALDRRGFVIDHRPGAGLRVSPHFYTLEEELDSFAAALGEVRSELRVGATA